MQCELLCAFRIGFYEAESDPLDALWFVEDEPDGLLIDLDGTPTLPIFLKCGFNRIPQISGGCFKSRKAFTSSQDALSFPGPGSDKVSIFLICGSFFEACSSGASLMPTPSDRQHLSRLE